MMDAQKKTNGELSVPGGAENEQSSYEGMWDTNAVGNRNMDLRLMS
jgi:hypothetical protein